MRKNGALSFCLGPFVEKGIFPISNEYRIINMLIKSGEIHRGKI